MFPKNPAEGDRETRRSSFTTYGYSAVLYRRILIACSAHSSAPSGAGREPCTAAGKDRLDVTADAHRLFQLGALGAGLGFQRWVLMSRGSEKPGPLRSAILRRSSHPFPREVLIIDSRGAKASHSCLTDRHRKAQGARIRRRTGRWRRPGSVKEKEEGKWCIFLKFHWLEALFQIGRSYRLFSRPRERVIGPPPTVFKKSGEMHAKLF